MDPAPAGFGKCAVCAYRDTGTPRICFECATETLEGLAKRRCDICDLPHGMAESACGNPWCKWKPRYFERNYSIAMRSGVLERAITKYKYDGVKGWAQIFARVLVGYLEAEHLVFSRFGLIIASPAFVGEGAERSWDHTRLVLQHASQLAPEWPFDLEEPPVIVKTASTEPMVGKGWKKRREIAEGPLRESLHVTAPTKVRGKRILVYDDVFTDGQTLREVARALKLADARQVCGITLGRQPYKGGASLSGSE